MHLTADMLGLAKPTAIRSVPTPEFGSGVNALLGEMSAIERDERIEVAWLKLQQERDNDGLDRAVGFTAFAVAASLCDRERNWLASDLQQIAAMAKKLEAAPAGVVARCFVEVSRLQGLSKEDVAALEKKLAKTPSDGPSSASPTP